MAVANTLAYYDRATITAVKSFIVQAVQYLFILVYTRVIIHKNGKMPY